MINVDPNQYKDVVNLINKYSPNSTASHVESWPKRVSAFCRSNTLPCSYTSQNVISISSLEELSLYGYGGFYLAAPIIHIIAKDILSIGYFPNLEPTLFELDCSERLDLIASKIILGKIKFKQEPQQFIVTCKQIFFLRDEIIDDEFVTFIQFVKKCLTFPDTEIFYISREKIEKEINPLTREDLDPEIYDLLQSCSPNLSQIKKFQYSPSRMSVFYNGPHVSDNYVSENIISIYSSNDLFFQNGFYLSAPIVHLTAKWILGIGCFLNSKQSPFSINSPRELHLTARKIIFGKFEFKEVQICFITCKRVYFIKEDAGDEKSIALLKFVKKFLTFSDTQFFWITKQKDEKTDLNNMNTSN